MRYHWLSLSRTSSGLGWCICKTLQRAVRYAQECRNNVVAAISTYIFCAIAYHGLRLPGGPQFVLILDKLAEIVVLRRKGACFILGRRPQGNAKLRSHTCSVTPSLGSLWTRASKPVLATFSCVRRCRVWGKTPIIRTSTCHSIWHSGGIDGGQPGPSIHPGSCRHELDPLHGAAALK